jgi:hypothetical protein
MIANLPVPDLLKREYAKAKAVHHWEYDSASGVWVVASERGVVIGIGERKVTKFQPQLQ